MKKIILLLLISSASFAQSTNPAPYCAAPGYTSSSTGGIIELKIGEFDHVSGVTGSYTYYNNIAPIGLIKGGSYPLTIVFDATGNDNSWGAITVDFNHSGDASDDKFTTCEPILKCAINSTNKPVSFFGNLDIPIDAPSGIGRLRVVRYGKTGIATTAFTCGTCNPAIGDIGETEDYDIYIKSISTTEVQNISKSEFSIYPNPSSDFINISSFKDIRDIFITNALGDSIFAGHESKIDISKFAPGIYFILINGEAHKFVKI